MNLFVLIFGFLIQHAHADSLTLHYIPSPKGVNWKNPRHLALSVVINQIARVPGGDRHEIGHVYEELTCGSNTLFTGMTSVGNEEERKNILKEGYGLGVLFKTFNGKLDDPEETKADIEEMQATGRSSFIRFQISESTCARLTQYIEEFKQNHYDQIYAGLNARPLYREGAGCTAFAASFLELSGLQIPEFEDQWMSSYIIPWKYIGGPLTGNHVSIFKILFAVGKPWSTDETAGLKALFWDPEKTHYWIQDLNYNILMNGPSKSYPWASKAVFSNNSAGIEFDTRDVPTPTDPIFKN